jgi:3-oxoadipate enol-lactonase
MPTVKVNGLDLFYEERGPKNAPAVVLAHSLFFDHRMFEHQLVRLSKRYRVVAYDQRGHGRSPWPADADYEMDTMASDAAGIVEALDLGPTHFVGASMGGFLALRLAARRPDLIRSTAALGSSAEREHKTEEYRALIAAANTYGVRSIVDTLMYIMFGDRTLADPAKAEMCAFWRAHMAALPNDIIKVAQAAMERRSVIDEIRRAQRPILAIAGSEDHAFVAASSENIAKAAPVGRCIIITGVGHSVPLEAPDEVNMHLLSHFEHAERL